MSQDRKHRAAVRERLQEALRRDRDEEALTLYDQLEKLEPTEPRWPHRRGDLLRRMGREWQAIECYERAVHAYVELGFVARAAAMAKVILSIDPSRTSILEALHNEQAPQPLPPPLPTGRDRGPRRSSLTTKAVKLEPADDTDEDEVRFIDIDIDVVEEPAEIRVSQIELEAREPIVLDDDDVILLDLDEEPDRVSVEALAELPAMPLLADVPHDALQRMIGEADLVEFGAGDAIVTAGDASDALFVLVEGQVEVKVPGRRLGAAILLGEGDVLGESCLLDDVHRAADVVGMVPGKALRIPKVTLDALVDEHPALGDVLLEILGRRLISNLLQTSPIFAAFDSSSRAELASLFEVRRADEGLVLVEAGKRSDGLYCTLLGKVELLARGQSRTMGPGLIFGQRTLLSQRPSRLGIRCASDVLLLRLSAQRFTTLAATYPTVLMYLSELADSDLNDPTG